MTSRASRSAARAPRNRLLPQTPSVLWDLTVAQNLDTFERLARVAPRLGRARWSRRVELGERLGVHAGELSGGERRRLELARAAARAAQWLVCDEPFAGIDPPAPSDGRSLASARHGRHSRGPGRPSCPPKRCGSAIAPSCWSTVDRGFGAPGTFREHPLVQRRYLATLDQGRPHG